MKKFRIILNVVVFSFAFVSAIAASNIVTSYNKGADINSCSTAEAMNLSSCVDTQNGKPFCTIVSTGNTAYVPAVTCVTELREP